MTIRLTGEKAHECLEMVEWLVTKGARKFILCLEIVSRTCEITRQISRLREQTKAIVVVTTVLKLDEIENARQFYEDTEKIAPLEAIFFVFIVSANP